MLLNLWDAIWNSIVSYLVTAAVGAVVVIALLYYRTVLRKVAGPMTPLVLGYLFVFAFVVILVILNQSQEIQERRQRIRLAQRTPGEVAREIPTWLYQSGFTITNNPQANMEFSLVAQDPQRRIIIGKYAGDPYIFLSTQIAIQPQQYARIDALVPRPDAPFALDLTIEVSKLGLEYDGIGYPLRLITLTLKLPFNESLNQFTFLNAFLRIRHGLIVVRSMILRAI